MYPGSPVREDGLSPEEGEVMDALSHATATYLGLPVTHPDEPAEFVDAIHRLQDLLAARLVRRDYPGWVEYQTDGEETALLNNGWPMRKDA